MRDGTLIRLAARAPFLAVENDVDGIAAVVAFPALRALQIVAALVLPLDGGVQKRPSFGSAEVGPWHVDVSLLAVRVWSFPLTLTWRKAENPANGWE